MLDVARLDTNSFITIAAILTFTAQWIFIWNFFYNIFKGRKATQNPWRSNTLEWTAPINPGHGGRARFRRSIAGRTIIVSQVLNKTLSRKTYLIRRRPNPTCRTRPSRFSLKKKSMPRI